MLMKTYLLDVLNKFQRFSENLDVKTILCNKAWLIFNDSGDKEVYIFQDDGTLLVSVNGEVSNAAWQYVSANKSLIISSDGHSYMLRPSFMDDVIFALQQDGTNKFAFMIHEEQSKYFQPKSLAELNAYFEAKVQKQLEAKRQAELNAIAEKRAEREQALRRMASEEWDKDKKYVLKSDSQYQALKRKCIKRGLIWTVAICLVILAFALFSTYSIFGNGLHLREEVACWVILMSCIVWFWRIIMLWSKCDSYIIQKGEMYINKYIKGSHKELDLE